MDLNINSPAYFSAHYGVDEEVYRFCQKVYLFFKDKKYSDTLHTIGIIPIIAPQELYGSGAWKEEVRFLGNRSIVSISLRMNFEEYYSADSSKKVLLMKELILKAVKKIKSTGKLDYEAFERDFQSI